MFDRIQPIRHSTFPIYTSMKYSVFDNIGLHTLPFQANTPPSVACQCSVNLNQSKNLCVLFSSIFVSYLFTQEMEWRTQNLLQNVPEKNKKTKHTSSSSTPAIVSCALKKMENELPKQIGIEKQTITINHIVKDFFPKHLLDSHSNTDSKRKNQPCTHIVHTSK